MVKSYLVLDVLPIARSYLYEMRGGQEKQEDDSNWILVPGSNPVQGWRLLSRNPRKITSAMAATTRLNRIRQSNTISVASKFKLYNLLSTPFFSMAVRHGPRSLTLRKGSRLSKPTA